MLLLVKNILFTIIVPGTVAGLLPYWLFGPYTGLQSSISILIAGFGLMAAGATLYAASVWPFATIGAGTPAPLDAPIRLVAAGPYRFVRNPMYLAVLSVILGQSLAFGSAALALYASVVALVFHLVVVGYEERVLERQFGDDYIEYCRRVPRWIPSFTRNSA